MFDQQGNLFAIQRHLDGLSVGFLNITKNGQTIGFVDVYNKTIYFYPNTTTPLFSHNGKSYANENPYIIYNKQGHAVASLNKDSIGNYKIIQMLDEKQQPTNSSEIANLINKEYVPLFDPYFITLKILLLLRFNKDVQRLHI